MTEKTIALSVSTAAPEQKTNQTLEILRSSFIVRGADLAARLSTTTRTVNRHVNRLRKLGYRIDGAAGLGYCLRGDRQP
ncbi:helix-turn-helix domain-containing protein [Tianweitania sediminis]|uniref:Helix-turn-helix domain-containing protein n=1 Tax=Tianweitania sediminis TaxID=1502156 RepID=A0A8J7RPG8_9HYPH|nr:helix-turn-helix domain-containing protein [Tianweitania sediminis]MBP0439614.1 helix-turn-helix domain-containing protein [Tianweitania sediminis]